MTPFMSLQNKAVLNPRGKSSAKSFSEVVKKYGGTPVEIPLIAFKPTELNSELEQVIKGIQMYDWIIFTSKVAVDTFLSYWSENVPVLSKIAAIGEKTAQVLGEKGFKVDFIPNEYVAESFVEGFSPRIKSGTKVLIPKGNLARDYISTELIKHGAKVDEITVYETVFPVESKAILAQKLSGSKLDIICFTSPSTVDHFMEVVEKEGLLNNLHTCIIVCIGPVAKRRAEKWGLIVQVVPTVYTVEAMIKSVVDYIKKESNL
jgi:uroporphyrinogen-III synthase